MAKSELDGQIRERKLAAETETRMTGDECGQGTFRRDGRMPAEPNLILTALAPVSYDAIAVRVFPLQGSAVELL